MGYDIYIGNGEMSQVEGKSPYSRIVKGETIYYKPFVKRIERPDAPFFPGDEMTGKSNARYPSYRAWDDFCKAIGLYGLFFDKPDGLMLDQPYYSTLSKFHSLQISAAVCNWKIEYPNSIARFGDEYPAEDAILARLLWLDWWVSWALQNCETPGIYNL